MSSQSSNLLPRPPFDPEITAALPPIPDPPDPMTPDMVHAQRRELAAVMAPIAAAILSDPAIAHAERTVPGPRGAIPVSVLAPKAPRTAVPGRRRQPGMVSFHGGGMTAGDRWVGMGMVAEWVKEFDAVAVTVEYRRAPEEPHPAPVEDCYAGLMWVGEHLQELGIDAERLMVVGESAGGGLAAAVALMVRDLGGPRLCAQLLVCPMLDDRSDSVSSRQFVTGGTWNRKRNVFGWKCLLGESSGGEGVSYYAAPARAKDLSGLPPAFIDVSSAEPFRDEDVAYASKLWECGVQAELHVWPGGIHAFHAFVPTAAVSEVANRTRTDWVRRILNRSPECAANETSPKI